MHADLTRRFRALLPACDFASLRVVDERTQQLSVRRDVLSPPRDQHDVGGMVTVHAGGGIGYAATADLSYAGLRDALSRAEAWARRVGPRFVLDSRELRPDEPDGSWETTVRDPWEAVPLAERVGLLQELSTRLHPAAPSGISIVDWGASLMQIDTRSLYVTPHGEARQRWSMISPDAIVVASDGADTQSRSLGRGPSRQGGFETLQETGFADSAELLVAEALQLITAPNCPSGTMDLILAPDQMMLQIHESIGHPLELDRILGDERNYAGTSFVTPEMFGQYQYGSALLDITFDPGVPGEFASYRWDDLGGTAQKVWLIRQGLLVAPLGGALSQARAGLSGVANTRASSWNRPPIDRMANLNLEPGDQRLDQLIAAVERGVLMRTNRSWSIDDRRDKFQFGCEWAQLIEDGQLGAVVKNPNYRGRSANFWRSLAGVGDRSTWEVHGTPFCGKGEPNQLIRVGHAAPSCRFVGIDVFGGA